MGHVLAPQHPTSGVRQAVLLHAHFLFFNYSWRSVLFILVSGAPRGGSAFVSLQNGPSVHVVPPGTRRSCHVTDCSQAAVCMPLTVVQLVARPGISVATRTSAFTVCFFNPG